MECYAYQIDPLMVRLKKRVKMQVLSILPNDLTNAELLNYYQIIIPHSTNTMREARIQVGMKEYGFEKEI